jgi:hypothetical protein
MFDGKEQINTINTKENIPVNPENIEADKFSKIETPEDLEKMSEEKISDMEKDAVDLDSDGKSSLENANKSVGLAEADVAPITENFSPRFNSLSEKIKGYYEIAKLRIGEILKSGDASDKNTAEKSEKPTAEKREKEITDPLDPEAKNMRNILLEGRGIFQLSKDEFNEYFSPNEFEINANLKQGNVGDCYAVAAIHALTCSPHFEMIVRSSMKKIPNGSWKVKVPLLNEDGQIITIESEELQPQKNKQFMKRGKDRGLMPDLRMNLKPMKGKEGLQALEAAFIKKTFGSVDRLASEGGFSEDTLVLLGGNNFIDCSVHFKRYNKEEKKWESQLEKVDDFLENFNPERHIATASTSVPESKLLKTMADITGGIYKGKDTLNLLVTYHAYSISNVDSGKKIVILNNPWNTSKTIKLTFDQFKKNFDQIGAIRIDNAKLLKNMKNIEKKDA